MADVVSRNHFPRFMSTLHFLNNTLVSEDEKKNDKLWKFRTWLNRFRDHCLKIVPKQNSIDEMIIPSKVKFGEIKQCIKVKPHPWGVKVWARTICDWHGVWF